MRAFDVVVVGLGAMGSAALSHLAKRGARVLGLEQFELDHTLGSSRSESRGFRKAYSSDASYVALAQRAQVLWQTLEQESGRALLRMTGALLVGPPAHPAVRGLQQSAEAHGLAYEVMNGSELERRYPALRAPDDYIAVLEREAGVLLAADCIDAYLDSALAQGAQVRANEGVVGIALNGAELVIRTASQTYIAGALVLTTGPWLQGGFADGALASSSLDVSLEVERQVELWFNPDSINDFEPERLPLFNYVFPEPNVSYYGIPALGAKGVKAARHYGGELVRPAEINRQITARDERDVRGFLARCLPRLDKRPASGKVCMNTNTKDRHFIVGLHPEHPHVVLAGGFSGHGFKFASVIGEVVADLALSRATAQPIALFSPTRFSVA